jgi:nucleoside-diphosphate kinase
VQPVAQVKADEAVGQPGREAEKPYPCCLSHHLDAPEVGCGRRRGRWPCSTLITRDSPRRNTLSQRTFSIVKPDAVRKGDTAAILAEIEKAGFKIVSIKRLSISKAQAEGFYHVHAARPFFGELTEFMSSGPIFPMVLEKDNAIADLRKLMGATDPAKAEEGTIRKKFAASIGENAIHGSDAEDTAAFEIGYFFAGLELK